MITTEFRLDLYGTEMMAELNSRGWRPRNIQSGIWIHSNGNVDNDYNNNERRDSTHVYRLHIGARVTCCVNYLSTTRTTTTTRQR